ncbi:MAG: hypothetical protein ACKOB6_01890 [Candidatus Kapaibacterium sp.]
MRLSSIIVTIILSVGAACPPLLGQIVDDTPIPVVPKRLRPTDAIQADTMPKAVTPLRDSLPGGGMPCDYPYSWYQDSVYYRALRLKIGPSIRFSMDAAHAMSNLELVRKKLQESPWTIALRNMTIADDAYRPDPRETVQRQLTINRALDAGLFRPNTTGGVTASFDQIGSVLGLTEDVSPRLRYEVVEPSEVTIVVYSTAATVVATILSKVHQPGTYAISWDLRDDKKREMPDGEYVMEARIGQGAYVRKRVVIGSKP